MWWAKATSAYDNRYIRLSYDFMRGYLSRMLQELGPMTIAEIVNEVKPQDTSHAITWITSLDTTLSWDTLIDYDPACREFYVVDKAVTC